MNLKHLSVYAIMIHKKYCIFIVTAFPNSVFFSCLIYFMASVSIHCAFLFVAFKM